MRRLGRGTGTTPLVVAVAAAAALTGAAVFTAAQAGCADPGRYEQHGTVFELVGGCVTRSDLDRLPRDERTTIGPHSDGVKSNSLESHLP
ncbi:hypothetical protein GCM10012275_44000 [Longimycelium tulufanense]|uniref:Secreted protein n=1 Tax=Longimycelium tulufanense TaxID=907463 RepID=A0A8J3CB78_9PSEU|nr:hypothetical protein [Longimycelium tulufanense]GGM68738.1 hypothetical protein GCM10012275_44000 [Longimycelium tulufanense]